MHKPWHTLVFGGVIFCSLAIISFSYPSTGIPLSPDFSLNFPKLATLFAAKSDKKDISKILKAADDLEAASDATNKADTAFIIEGPPKEKERKDTRDSVRPLITGIQMRNKNALNKFFKALSETRDQSGPAFHVLHYGDSQIEGDRITDYLRDKWQSQFGGGGTGLINFMPVTQSILNKVVTGTSWDKYNVFTAKDKRVTHNNYGVLAGFNRYTTYKQLYDTSVVITTSVSVSTNKKGSASARAYKRFKLFYGGARRRTWCEYYDGPALMAADSLAAGGFFNVREFPVTAGSLEHTLRFKGKDSPDLYAMSLESDHGIIVDNIALRGSSGTFFHQINNEQLKRFYEYLNVKLIILQFGGNALPAIQNETMAVNYAGYLKGQLSIIKRLAPQASILFVGPSDMNIKEGTEYVTYPYLEKMRDEIKKAVLESDCAFFDLYDCMGGRNSMASWVEAKLAASDYIHFSPQGARKIATLFYSALMNEYNTYLKQNGESGAK